MPQSVQVTPQDIALARIAVANDPQPGDTQAYSGSTVPTATNTQEAIDATYTAVTAANQPAYTFFANRPFYDAALVEELGDRRHDGNAMDKHGPRTMTDHSQRRNWFLVSHPSRYQMTEVDSAAAVERNDGTFCCTLAGRYLVTAAMTLTGGLPSGGDDHLISVGIYAGNDITPVKDESDPDVALVAAFGDSDSNNIHNCNATYMIDVPAMTCVGVYTATHDWLLPTTNPGDQRGLRVTVDRMQFSVEYKGST